MLVLMLPRVWSRVFGFPVASPCLWGKLQNISFSKVSSRLSCRFAGQALHFVTFQVSKVVVWQAQCFLHRFHKMSCSFRGRGSSLEISVVILRGRRSISVVSLYTPHYRLHTHPFTLHTPRTTFHTLDFTLHILHFTLHTPHFKRHTLHTTLYTLHIALLNPRSTLYTPHFTLHTLHFTFRTLHPTLNT